MKRQLMEGSVSVSGPGFEREGLPNVGAGISGALTAASRRGEGTFYVRDGDRMVAHVSWDNGVIRVFPITKGAS